MPKDNEVDEKVVAWMLTRKRDGFIRATYNVKPTDEQIAIAEHDGDVYVPLTYAATVAELRAAVADLKVRLDREEQAHSRTIGERDRAEEALGDMFTSVTGRPAEWSSAWGYPDAIEEVEDHVTVTQRKADAAERRVGELEKLLAAARRAIGDHHAPNDCYATGPMTGDEYLDLVQCPACAFLYQYANSIKVAP